MIITEQKVRELQQRINVSYEIAERYLYRANGDIDRAEAYAYKRKHSLRHRIWMKVKALFAISIVYRIKVYDKEAVYLDVPLFLLFVIFIVTGFGRFLLLAGLLFGSLIAMNIQTKIYKDEDTMSFESDKIVKNQDDLGCAKVEKEQMYGNDIVDEKMEIEDRKIVDKEEKAYFEVTIDK